MLSNGVEYPVHLGGPSTVMSVIHLFHEVVQRFLWETKGYTIINQIKVFQKSLERSPKKITGYEEREKPHCLFSFLQGQCFPNVGNVIKRLQLRHARAQHHGEQIDEEISMLPDCQVRFIAHLLESGGRRKQV